MRTEGPDDQTLMDYDYDYFPRGRVNWRKEDNKWLLVLDPKLNRSPFITHIVLAWNIPRKRLGVVTEDFNRRWYELNTGQTITNIQQRIFHPALRWMAATIDGRVQGSDAVFEAKFMLPWSFSEEGALEKYAPQLQHNMWVVAARTAVLSVINRAPVRRNGGDLSNVAAQMLTSEASAQLRDRLLGELKELDGPEGAAVWARRSLPEKNKLTAADAKCIEEAFQGRQPSLTTLPAQGISQTAEKTEQPGTPTPKARKRSRSNSIDKSVLALPEPRRVRDRDHVRYVAKQPCLICDRRPADAHHLRFMQGAALGRKVSDEFTVPLCRGHHREVHRCGDEAAWWNAVGLDPTIEARALWLQTHPNLKVSSQTQADTAEPSPIMHAKKARRRSHRANRTDAKSAVNKTGAVRHGIL